MVNIEYPDGLTVSNLQIWKNKQVQVESKYWIVFCCNTIQEKEIISIKLQAITNVTIVFYALDLDNNNYCVGNT